MEQELDVSRFTDPSVLILVSLSGGPLHGYAIQTDVERITGRPLGPGTLYGALARLEKRGLIEALPAEDRRHPYRLTSMGAALLGRLLATLKTVVELGERRLEGVR